jgi:hypothetical protein
MSEIHGDISRYNYNSAPLEPISSHNDAAPLPASPPPPLPPRERLKHAFDSVESARSKFQNAQGLALKAAKALEGARATFKGLQSAEHDIREWKVKAFKDDSGEPMPPDLLEARREAIHAAEDLQHAEALAEQMADELAVAERVCRATEQLRSDAVNVLVMEEVGHIVDEIKELGRRRQYLRDILRGVSLVNASRDQHQKLSLLVEPFMHDHLIAQLAYPPSSPGSRKYWKDFSEALSSDPAAELGQPPAAADLWS